MRVLVLTNHFAEFAGSETVAREVAMWFLEQGDDVTLAANLIRAPSSDFAPGVKLFTNIEEIDIAAFDLIWCQHSLLSMLPLSAFERACEAGLPHIALVSLSPHESYEHLDGMMAAAVSAEIYANSPETAAEVARRNCGLVALERIQVFHNAAPATFWREPSPKPSQLSSVLVISNHAPPELSAALQRLSELGISVRHIGMHKEYKLVEPADIDSADALITIGKSATYGVARRKAIYMYDHFGGDGWLTCANFDLSIANNFSGRPNRRLLSEAAIVREIINGFEHAADAAQRFEACFSLDRLRLDCYLAPLRERAAARSRWRSFTLRRWLGSARFRAHLEAARQSSLVMKRSYLQANGGL